MYESCVCFDSDVDATSEVRMTAAFMSVISGGSVLIPSYVKIRQLGYYLLREGWLSCELCSGL
jgi:hypothetical protein